MKLLHKVVKSSQGLNYDGIVSIDNTIVIKPKYIFDAEEDGFNNQLAPELESEVRLRVAHFQNEMSIREQQVHNDINNNRSKIISEAMTEAERIRRDAETEAIVLREKARDTGFESGRQEALSQMSNSINAAASLLSELNAKKDTLYISQENELIDLAYDMVKKITLSEIKTDRDIIFGIVKQACKNFRNSDFVKISLAKCDISESVVTDEKLLKFIAGNIPDVEIELLHDAESGTIILDNDKEIIDASVPTQLELLQEIMNFGKRPVV